MADDSNTIYLKNQTTGAIWKGPPSNEPVPPGWEVVPGSKWSDSTWSGQLTEKLTEGLHAVGRGYDAVRDPVMGGITNFLTSATELPQDWAEGLSDALIPDIDATGAMAGAGMGYRYGGWKGAVGGGILGGLSGGMTKGRPLRGAVEGGVIGAAGPAGKWAGGALRRGFYQRGADDADVGAALGTIAPQLGSMRTAVEMQDTMRGLAGKVNAGEAYRAGLNAIDEHVGVQPLRSRALAEHLGRPLVPAEKRYWFPESQWPLNAKGPISPLDPPTQPTFTFREAADAIRDIRLKGFSHRTGTPKEGLDAAGARALRNEIVEDVVSGLRDYTVRRGTVSQLGPDSATSAADLLLDANRSYKAAEGLLRMFEIPGILSAETKSLNMPLLQETLATMQRQLETELGREGWTVLREAIYRGAMPPAMDRQGINVTRLFQRGVAGGASEGVRIPIWPTRFIGKTLQVPAAPFIGGSGELVNALEKGWNPTPGLENRGPYR